MLRFSQRVNFPTLYNTSLDILSFFLEKRGKSSANNQRFYQNREIWIRKDARRIDRVMKLNLWIFGVVIRNFCDEENVAKNATFGKMRRDVFLPLNFQRRSMRAQWSRIIAVTFLWRSGHSRNCAKLAQAAVVYLGASLKNSQRTRRVSKGGKINAPVGRKIAATKSGNFSLSAE